MEFFKKIFRKNNLSENFVEKEEVIRKQEKKKNNFNLGSNFLVHGKNVTFYVCSIISALINLIFISNLTKSPYNIGGLFSIPAAIFLGSLSIALDCSKLLHVVQVNTLKELYRKLSKYNWSKNIKKVTRKWNAVYLLYVGLSIITSVSLSTISIGEGIHRNQAVIQQIDKDIARLTRYEETGNTADSLAFSDAISNARNEGDAVVLASDTFKKIKPIIEDYRNERAEFLELASFSSVEEITYKGKKIIPNNYWDKRNSEVVTKIRAAGVSLSLNEIRTLSDQDIQKKIKASQTSLTTNNSAQIVKNLDNQNKLKYKEEIHNLQDKYNYPSYYDENGKIRKGSVVVFDETSLTKTISQLEQLKVRYENDSGDIGSSSKIFMQLGTTVDSRKNKAKSLEELEKSDTKVSSIGTTELLMMLMLLFLSLLCELAINQFSPKVRISRKMLYQFSEYFPSDFDVDKFMKENDKELKKYDMLDIDREDELKVIDRAIKKSENKKEKFSPKVDNLVAEIEKLIS